jgi:hypothetical protein
MTATLRLTENEIELELPRGRGGQMQLRVTSATANGEPFVTLREFVRSADGRWLGGNRYITLRASELQPVRDALDNVMRRHGGTP